MELDTRFLLMKAWYSAKADCRGVSLFQVSRYALESNVGCLPMP